MCVVHVWRRLNIINVVNEPRKMEIQDCLVSVVDGGTPWCTKLHFLIPIIGAIVDGGFSWFGQCAEDIVLISSMRQLSSFTDKLSGFIWPPRRKCCWTLSIVSSVGNVLGLSNVGWTRPLCAAVRGGDVALEFGIMFCAVHTLWLGGTVPPLVIVSAAFDTYVLGFGALL
ncbi:hypothetical protein CEXT_344521 [Caerostris extrusa]|uniref:Uncharacterized protein n=1 Tax=Caerostris extrusa TaxID=172846 RepID=A0AAV4VYJ0_CAEEX|nr:hypothetical protein CEXT_344521 [Caerostris extrusa]